MAKLNRGVMEQWQGSAHLPAALQIPGGDSRLSILVGLFSLLTFNDEKFISV
jgi:hypothetical protein